MLKSLMKKLKNLIDTNGIEATLKESKDDVLASADEFFSEHINSILSVTVIQPDKKIISV